MAALGTTTTTTTTTTYFVLHHVESLWPVLAEENFPPQNVVFEFTIKDMSPMRSNHGKDRFELKKAKS